MRRFFSIVCLLLGLGLSVAVAGSYTLSDGNVLTGEPISFDQNGVVIKSGDNSFSPRTSYDKFTQDGLRALLTDAKKPSDKAFFESLIEEAPQEKAKRKSIVINPVTAPERPTKGTGLFAAFTSPVGIVIFLVLYGATIFAAFEVSLFRNQPPGLVCGLAAVPFLGVLSPIIFLSMPTRTVAVEEVQTHAATDEAMPGEAAPSAPSNDLLSRQQVTSEAVPAPESSAPAQPRIPAPVVFKKGEFSFNRRFFETKLAGFLRMVPSAAEKDMVVYIKSLRGEYVGRRVMKINPGDLVLQVFKNEATAEEVIPFTEVLEVQIRHKDLA